MSTSLSSDGSDLAATSPSLSDIIRHLTTFKKCREPPSRSNMLDSGLLCVNLPCVEMTRLPQGRARCSQNNERTLEAKLGGIYMANKEFELTPNVYMFAGVGAVIIGGLAAFALGGVPNTIAAAVVGGLAGGCLGLFF
jgi:hypothetical protein